MKALLVLFAVLSLSGCLPSPLAVSDDHSLPDVTSEQEVKEDTFDFMIQKDSASSAWELAQDEKFNFSLPVNWYYEVERNENLLPRSASYVIQVRDTAELVVLGAVSLSDSFDGAQDSNAEKIATEYTAFNVLVYSGEVDFTDLSWTDFFADYYPEVLTFESFVLAGKPEVNAVVVTKTDGMWLGSKRVFVHVKDSFYDFSLHTTRSNQEKAEELFWDFVHNFQL
ncbi:MAG: hypothetical protein UT32_C0013G0016 [Parcubacteria group bacterium GW2011_GWC2_39_14]|nr:MAG: hypothetical protein UT32_C0013G0016 [Parcubacteria group bacterium GW2011_GWC2_39_14]KKR54504.1 MAG: hypothetical protein UT91_C0014G0016 [Parcubacteria group bacterium GW2011_GWA2_40_23]